jgi:hypothetical protein
MDDYLNSKGLCHICREELTTINAELAPGQHIFVCKTCLESAKQNFIWICVHCGNVFIRPKSLVLRRLKDPELKRALTLCEDEQIIQGIDSCIECSPEEIGEFVATAKAEKNGGHC